MSCRRTSVLGVVLLIAVACDAARAIDVQVPSSTTLAGPGQTGSVAVSIAPLVAQDMVLSGALSFTYAAGVATATAATPTALLAGCTTTTNLTPGMVTLIFACTVPLSSGGTLFDVAFQGVAVGVRVSSGVAVTVGVRVGVEVGPTSWMVIWPSVPATGLTGRALGSCAISLLLISG